MSGAPASAGPRGAGVAGLLLAAGASRRMGPDVNKLLAPIEGRPLVTRPLDAMLAAGVAPVLVVLGHEAERVRSTLGDRPCETAVHPDWAQGMGASLAFGVRTLGERVGAGLLVCVGDLPGLRAADVEALLSAFAAEGASGAETPSRRILVPTHRGARGHPVLFGAAHLEALASLRGDEGGRSILATSGDDVREVPVASDGVVRDVDTPADLAVAETRS